MGTSLSGLTPATTFDGLLKTSDNEPLDGTLKAISTGDGTDTILQLSNSALQVNGPTTINGAQMTIVGATNDNTTNALVVQNSDGIELLKVRNERYAQLGTSTIGIHTLISSNANWIKGNANYLQDTSSNYYGNIGSSGIQIGNGSAAATARLQVKGSGATSATTSLLVQNSAGTELFKLTDDGTINLGVPGDNPTIQSGSNAGKSLTLGSTATLSALNINLSTYNGINYTPVLSVTGNTDQFVGIGETTPTARLHVKGSGNTNTTTSLLVQNSDGTDTFKVDDAGSATATSFKTTALAINSNQILGTSGIRLRNTTQANGGTSVSTADSAPANTMLYVKGFGATSATTSLLVQNSAGTELFKVQDDGTTEFGTGGGLKINFRTITGAANSNKSIEISDATTYSTRNGHIFKTYDGTAYIEAMRINGVTNPFVGIGESTPTARLQVKGSGNDATTTALLVQNSDGADLLKVTDTGVVTVDDRLIIGLDSVTDLNRIKTAALSIGSNIFYAASGTQVHIKGSGATSATTALLVQNSAGTDLLKVVDDGQLEIKSNSGRVSTTSGTSIFSYTSGGGGVLDVNPSNGNSVKFRARGDNDTFLIQTNPAGDNVGIGASSPDSTAKLQVDSTTQGFLPPRMTTTQRDAITTPAAGLMVYNTTTNKAQCYNGTAWQDLF